MDKIICIAGPTASGKTSLAVELAKLYNGEVISCDSMQIYKRMDIGTAKPTKDEMQDIPHHMLDVAEADEDCSVSRYCEIADPIVRDILSRGKTVIIAGGTGLYMDALIKGNDFAPFPSTGRREELEALAATEGIEAVIEQLRIVDPEALDRSQGNPRRIIRAMEVYLETGETITAHNLKTQAIPPKYQPVWFALEDENRKDLYDRIDHRVDIMLEQGLVDEIKNLLASGIPSKCTAMQAIGYKEFIAALDGQCTIAEAAEAVKTSSRHYAKRQLTWFRRNPNVIWLRRAKGETTREIVEKARPFLRDFDK